MKPDVYQRIEDEILALVDHWEGRYDEFRTFGNQDSIMTVGFIEETVQNNLSMGWKCGHPDPYNHPTYTVTKAEINEVLSHLLKPRDIVTDEAGGIEWLPEEAYPGMYHMDGDEVIYEPRAFVKLKKI